MQGTYAILRKFQHRDIRPQILKRGLTLEAAQGHCLSPEACSQTATSEEAQQTTKTHGHWIDQYTKESRL